MANRDGNGVPQLNRQDLNSPAPRRISNYSAADPPILSVGVVEAPNADIYQGRPAVQQSKAFIFYANIDDQRIDAWLCTKPSACSGPLQIRPPGHAPGFDFLVDDENLVDPRDQEPVLTLVMSTTPENPVGSGAPSEVRIAKLDSQAADFTNSNVQYLKVSGDELMSRGDPEPLAIGDKAYVYYREMSDCDDQFYLHRAATRQVTAARRGPRKLSSTRCRPPMDAGRRPLPASFDRLRSQPGILPIREIPGHAQWSPRRFAARPCSFFDRDLSTILTRSRTRLKRFAHTAEPEGTARPEARSISTRVHSLPGPITCGRRFRVAFLGRPGYRQYLVWQRDRKGHS